MHQLVELEIQVEQTHGITNKNMRTNHILVKPETVCLKLSTSLSFLRRTYQLLSVAL